jgi:hypothetical protein
VDVLVLEHGTDHYLGRLCRFNRCCPSFLFCPPQKTWNSCLMERKLISAYAYS